MGWRPAVPDTALAAVRRYCDNKIPAQHRDEVRVECGIRGRAITIYECQPPWHPNLGSHWTRQRVAQLRYDPDGHHWRLYYADRNSRWRYYDMAEPTPRLDELLAEIDEDPTGIFWRLCCGARSTGLASMTPTELCWLPWRTSFPEGGRPPSRSSPPRCSPGTAGWWPGAGRIHTAVGDDRRAPRPLPKWSCAWLKRTPPGVIGASTAS
jgi:hypothetical protein